MTRGRGGEDVEERTWRSRSGGAWDGAKEVEEMRWRY